MPVAGRLIPKRVQICLSISYGMIRMQPVMSEISIEGCTPLKCDHRIRPSFLALTILTILDRGRYSRTIPMSR